jgi:hypothetical protein
MVCLAESWLESLSVSQTAWPLGSQSESESGWGTQ